MRTRTIFAVSATAALLISCEAEIGKEEGRAEAGNEAGETSNAQQGKLSIDAPGFEMKIDLPSLSEHADVETSGESDLLYPGSRLGAMHIDAKQDQGRVELRFATRDGIETVANWYRDPARSTDFEISSPRRDGDAYLFTGKDTNGGGSFQLRLQPAQDGGTAGQFLLTEG